MSRIEKYKTSLLFGRGKSRERRIQDYAKYKNITVNESEIIISSFEEELLEPVTLTRIRQLRAELNPSFIGVGDGTIVPKRKYVRKTQRVVDEVQLDVIEEVVQEVKVPGIFKIGDIVKIIENSNSSCNNIGEIGVVIEGIEKSNSRSTVRVKVGNRNSNSNNTRIDEIEHHIEKTKAQLELERLDLIEIEKRYGCDSIFSLLIESIPPVYRAGRLPLSLTDPSSAIIFQS